MSDKQGTKAITNALTSFSTTFAPLIAMTGVGIPLALAMQTCSMCVKMLDDKNELSKTIKSCEELLKQWSKHCINFNIIVETYKSEALGFYEGEITNISTKEDIKPIYVKKKDLILDYINDTETEIGKFNGEMKELSNYLYGCLKYSLTNAFLTYDDHISHIQKLNLNLTAKFGNMQSSIATLDNHLTNLINAKNDSEILEQIKEQNEEQNGGGSSLWNLGKNIMNTGKEQFGKVKEKAMSVIESKVNLVKARLARMKPNELEQTVLSEKIRQTIFKEQFKAYRQFMKSYRDDQKAFSKDQVENKIKGLEQLEITKGDKTIHADFDTSAFIENNKDKDKATSDAVRTPETTTQASQPQTNGWFGSDRSFFRKKNATSSGGLSTRRKRKRRPKFHQVRSYKQRPKQQHRLK